VALTAARYERIAAADDDVTGLADHQLVLAAFVVCRLPAKQVAVKGRTRLVVFRSEREVIQPHGLPASGLKRQRLTPPGRRRRLAVASVPVAVSNLQIESVGILDMEALESLAVVVGYRRESAFPKLGFNRFGIPWLDDEPERRDLSTGRRATGSGRCRA